MLKDVAAGASWMTNKVSLAFKHDESRHLTAGNVDIQSYDRFDPDGILVTIYLSQRLHRTIPTGLQQGKEVLRLCCVVFSQGVDLKQSMAHLLRRGNSQDCVNRVSFRRLCAYFQDWCRIVQNSSQRSIVEMHDKAYVAHLQQELLGIGEVIEISSSSHKKNVNVLVTSSDFCRKIGGSRITCCKSGKDRTAMSVTLENARLLTNQCQVVDGIELCNKMRQHGVRRRNVHHNTGNSNYAFNALQVQLLPHCYRPPQGSYGSGAT